MKTKRLLIFSILCALLLSSCAAAQRSATSLPNVKSGIGPSLAGAPTAAPAPSIAYESLDAAVSNGSTAAVKGGVANATTSESNQMVIQNASLSILVDDPAKSLSDIMKMASDMGGFTVTSNRYQAYTPSGDQVPEATVTIRVPAEKLNNAMDQIKALTGDPDKFVTNESVSGEDITQQYTDLNSRLRNLQEAADELTKLYDKADKTDDILAIYNQKMQVTEQIEVLKGQIQYYDQAVAKSAISVQIQAKASAQPITVAGWQPKGIVRDAVQALLNFFKGLVNFLIWVVILVVPIALVIGLPLFFLIRWLVRRSKSKKSPNNTLPPLPDQK